MRQRLLGRPFRWRPYIWFALAGAALVAACGSPAQPEAAPAAAETPPAVGRAPQPSDPSGGAPGTGSGGTDAKSQLPRPFEGFLAPDWQGTDVLTGQPLSASDLRGKVVYLNFFATWCPPCRVEMPDMERFAAAAGEEVAVVAIGTDPTEGPEELAEFARSLGLSFAIVHDGAEAARRYLVSGIPTSLFIDAEGRVRVRITGMLDYEAMKLAAEAAGATGLESADEDAAPNP